MHIKIYEGIKKFIKNYWPFILIYLFLAFIFLFPLPYVVSIPGGAINVRDNYELASDYLEKGSFNLTYVTSKRGTPLNLLLALLSTKRDITKLKEEVLTNESYRDMLKRESFDFLASSANAKIVALEKSGNEYHIIKERLIVTYFDKYAQTDLKLYDEIIKIDGKEVASVEEIKNIVNEKKTTKKYQVSYLRNNIEKEGYFKSYYDEDSDSYKIGVLIYTVTELESNPVIKEKRTRDLYGGSAGLMNTLEIYNRLTETDLTGGKKICGTGTIEKNGIVGSIGGIKYKLIGADKKNCDLFITPSDNYLEAKKVKEKYHLKIKLIKVNDFDEAVKELEKLL